MRIRTAILRMMMMMAGMQMQTSRTPFKHMNGENGSVHLCVFLWCDFVVCVFCAIAAAAVGVEKRERKGVFFCP